MHVVFLYSLSHVLLILLNFVMSVYQCILQVLLCIHGDTINYIADQN